MYLITFIGISSKRSIDKPINSISENEGITYNNRSNNRHYGNELTRWGTQMGLNYNQYFIYQNGTKQERTILLAFSTKDLVKRLNSLINLAHPIINAKI